MPAPWPDSYFYPAPGYEGYTGVAQNNYTFIDDFTGADGAIPNILKWTRAGSPDIQNNTLEITSVEGNVEYVQTVDQWAANSAFDAYVDFDIQSADVNSYAVALQYYINSTTWILVAAVYTGGVRKYYRAYNSGSSPSWLAAAGFRGSSYGTLRLVRLASDITITPYRKDGADPSYVSLGGISSGWMNQAGYFRVFVGNYSAEVLPSITCRFNSMYVDPTTSYSNLVPRRVWGKVFNGPWPDINGVMIDVDVAPGVDRYINTNHNTVTAWSVLNSSTWNLYWDISGYTWRIRSAVFPSTTYVNDSPWFSVSGITSTADFIQTIKDNMALMTPTPVDPDVDFTWNNFYDRPASSIVPGMIQGSSFAQAKNATASFSVPETQSIYGGDVDAVAQSFTVTGATVKLWYAWFIIKSTARLNWSSVYDNPPPSDGTFYCKIYSHTGAYGSTGVPDTLLATSLPYVTTRWDNSYLMPFRFEGAEAIDLPAGNYFVSVECVDGDATHHVKLSLDTSAPSHGGNLATRTGGVWTAAATKDMIFYINSGSGLFFDDANGTLEERVVDSSTGGEHWYPAPYTTKAGGENVTFSSGNTGKWGPSVYWQWALDNATGMQYVLDYELNMLSGSYPIAIGQTVTGDSTGATATMRAALAKYTGDGNGQTLFGLHDVYAFYNEQIYFDGLDWSNVNQANAAVVNETSEIDTYIDFNQYRASGLPDWPVGAVIMDNLAETWLLVLPWDANRRRYFLYGAPTPSTTKIYYDKVDLLTNDPTWTWYPEIAGSGSVP